MRVLPLLLIFLVACAHSVHMNSDPLGAKVTVDGRFVGNTPLVFEEKTGTKSYQVRVEKDGYVPYTAVLTQDVINQEYALGAGAGAAAVAGGGCIAGMFVCWPLYWGGGILGAGALVYSIFQNKQLLDSYHFPLEPLPKGPAQN